MYIINKIFLIGVSILVLIAIIYLSATLPSKLIEAHESEAISHLKIILGEEVLQKIVQHLEIKKYVSLNELRKGNNSIPQPGQVVHGYRFDVRVKADGKSFEAIAIPAEYNKTGRLSFYGDESGKIRGADKGGAEADSNDPELSAINTMDLAEQ